MGKATICNRCNAEAALKVLGNAAERDIRIVEALV
jgi:hypothetical protein